MSWRITSGTPPSSSSALGRPPSREPAPAASSTAPTDMRLYSPLLPLRMQPMSVPCQRSASTSCGSSALTLARSAALAIRSTCGSAACMPWQVGA